MLTRLLNFELQEWDQLTYITGPRIADKQYQDIKKPHFIEVGLFKIK